MTAVGLPAVAAEPTPGRSALPTEDLWSAANSMEQVTSVSQLSDVRPTDWAFQALSRLIENYGCIAGYPDGTFRGNRPMTRYEFAAGLNACLDAISERLGNGVSREDLDAIRRLQQEFQAELATLRGRVDALEGRVNELEANQFSTTTKLSGETILTVNDLFGDQVGPANNTVLQYRTRLSLNTSFNGRDRLVTRLVAANQQLFSVPNSLGVPPAGIPFGNPIGTAEGGLASEVGSPRDNTIRIDRLSYSLPLGDRVEAHIFAAGGRHSEYVSSTASPFFNDFDGGNGATSAFAQFSPIYRIGGGAGAGLNFAFDTDQRIVLSLGYLAENANNPANKNGLFNGDYAALGQLTFRPSDSIQLGLTYVHGYHTRSVFPGTAIANTNAIFDSGLGENTFFTGNTPANVVHGVLGVPAVSNSYGVEASFRVAPGISLNAFGGYTNLTLLGTGNGDVWYYGLGVALPDLGGRGNLGGIMVGMEPSLVGLRGRYSLADLGLDNDTSLHLEAFYRWQVNDSISVTPGVIFVTAPEQGSSGFDSFVVGTLRTTFRF